MPRRKAPVIPDAILDQLLAGADAKTAFHPDGLIDQLRKALAERALNAEMAHHLAGDEAGNSRNGYSRKTATTETGRLDLEVPRDRQSTFDPPRVRPGHVAVREECDAAIAAGRRDALELFIARHPADPLVAEARRRLKGLPR